jgi:hypothetical protein
MEPTLGQIAASRNRKTFPSCAETVDDATCLWKAEEKRALIQASLIRIVQRGPGCTIPAFLGQRRTLRMSILRPALPVT